MQMMCIPLLLKVEVSLKSSQSLLKICGDKTYRTDRWTGDLIEGRKDKAATICHPFEEHNNI